MVRDVNRFPEVRDAFDEGLADGLVALHSEVLGTTLDNMAKGQDALGRDWKPVEPETLASRKVRTSDPSPLVDTGTMRADINSTSTVNTRELTAIIGSTLKYAEVHELGAPEAGIPRRPIFGPAGILARNIARETIGDEIDVALEGATL